MKLILTLADAIRKDNFRNLFCILEMGEKGTIVVFSSGEGWVQYGDHIDSVMESAKGTERQIILHEGEYQADGEERMADWFEYYYNKHGEGNRYMNIVTHNSPCAAKCTATLIDLAEEWSKLMWQIGYLYPYKPQGDRLLQKSLKMYKKYSLELRNFRVFWTQKEKFYRYGWVEKKQSYGRQPKNRYSWVKKKRNKE